jgi:hypothetical protein
MNILALNPGSGTLRRKLLALPQWTWGGTDRLKAGGEQEGTFAITT